MDYLGIIKKSLSIVWRYKFLWALGILASLTGRGIGNFNFYNFNSGSWPSEFPQPEEIKEKIGIASLDGVIKGTSTQSIINEIGNWLSTHWLLILLITLIIFIVGLVLVVISICAQGGLITAVNDLENNQKSSFSRAMKDGWHKFWSLVGVLLIIGLISFIFIAYIVVSFLVSYFYGSKIFTMIWVASFVPILFVLFVYLGLLSTLALRVIMIEKTGAIEGLKRASSLIFVSFKEVILGWLVSVVLGIVISLAFLLGLGIILLILGIFGAIAYSSAKMVLFLIYIGIFGTVFLILMVLVSGFIQAFLSAYWTLIYRELKT